MKVPNANPKAGYLAYKEEIDAAVMKTLESGWYILGQEVSGFENDFAKFIGTEFCCGVASGTDGLEIALRALDIGHGDKVITVSHTAVATVAAIESVGAQAVLLDIDRDTFTLSPERLENYLKNCPPDKTPKAVIPVHIYGHPCDMPEISKIAEKYNIKIIEDCAQAHGAKINGKTVGSFGDISEFSFYPTKNLGAIGDGGAVCTNSQRLFDKIKLLQQYGWKERYISKIAGINSRLDELQAAILRIKLSHLGNETKMRQNIAKCYNSGLSDIQQISLPQVKENCDHVFHLYVIRVKNREEFNSYLNEKEIGTGIHFPCPIHLQPAYKGRIETDPLGMQETESAAEEVLSLPMFPQLTEEMQDYTIRSIRDYFA